jgi:hypothetical protein
MGKDKRSLFQLIMTIPDDENEDDCGNDFAEPIRLNNGYTLDYSSIASDHRKKDDHHLCTPEPTTFLLALIGLAFIVFRRNKRVFNS